MLLYRIAKSKQRSKDLSGTGAFKFGGRWNSQGTYMLYTSENSSLAFLENIVHFEPDNLPPHLFIACLELKADDKLVYELPTRSYPKDWMTVGSLANRVLGDKLMEEEKHLAIKVKSAINPFEYNYLLNPLFPGYHELFRIKEIHEIPVDQRLYY